MDHKVLIRAIDRRICIVAFIGLMAIFMTGFAADAAQPQEEFWYSHVDLLKWVVWALFAYMVWSVKHLLEKLENKIDTMDKDLRQVEASLTELIAEHELIQKKALERIREDH